MFRRLLLPALLLGLSACASDEPQGHFGGRSGGRSEARSGGQAEGRADAPKPVRLFISPSGEPFRGEGGLARWFAQVDTDHDGAVTLAEFRADAQHSFKVLDTNGDGVIDGFEMQAYERDIVPEIGLFNFDEGGQGPERRPRRSGGGSSPRTRDGGGMGGGSHVDAEELLRQQSLARAPAGGRDGAARFSLLNEPQPIAGADADLDGKVTIAEWMAMTDRRFAKLDYARTGKLTLGSLLKGQPKDQKGHAGAPPR